MQPDRAKLLEDVRDAAAFILEITSARTLNTYVSDRLVRQAVERNFEIIGEALGRLGKLDATLTARVGEIPRIIAFRNIIAHGYDVVDHAIVWYVIQQEVPALLERVTALLGEPS